MIPKNWGKIQILTILVNFLNIFLYSNFSRLWQESKVSKFLDNQLEVIVFASSNGQFFRNLEPTDQKTIRFGDETLLFAYKKMCSRVSKNALKKRDWHWDLNALTVVYLTVVPTQMCKIQPSSSLSNNLERYEQNQEKNSDYRFENFAFENFFRRHLLEMFFCGFDF